MKPYGMRHSDRGCECCHGDGRADMGRRNRARAEGKREANERGETDAEIRREVDAMPRAQAIDGRGA